MGFTHVGVAPVFAAMPGGDLFLADDLERAPAVLGVDDSADGAAGRIAALLQEHGLQLIIDIVLDQVARDGTMARSAPGWFHERQEAVVDPRHAQPALDAAPARFEDENAAAQMRGWWVDRLVRLARAGASGFRLLGLENTPVDFLQPLLREVRFEEEDCAFFGWTPGVSRPRYGDLERVRLDGVFASTAWWDGRASWFVEEHNALRRIAPVLSVVEAPYGERLAAQSHRDLHAACRRALNLALATGHGLFVPMGFEHGAPERMSDRLDGDVRPTPPALDFSEDVRATNAFAAQLALLGQRGEMRRLSDAEEVVAAHFIAGAADVRAAERGLVLLVNTDAHEMHPPATSLEPLDPAAGGAFGRPQPVDATELNAPLAPAEARLLSVARTSPVQARARRQERAISELANGPRVAIEGVTPSVDDGTFAIKRIVGRSIDVAADIFTDGHELLGAELLWKPADAEEWSRVGFVHGGNDRWQAAFTPTRIGRHLYCVEAWRDDYGSLCHDIAVKHQAGVDIAIEITEARQHLQALPGATENERVRSVIAVLEQGDPAASVAALTATETHAVVDAIEPRAFVARSDELAVEIERPQAEFASWYELFPRSQSGDPHRHGTFLDVVGRLPDIHRMGFDVLYFPPIHPIGRTNRKGRNNSLAPGPDDPGSPYAIGAEEGGHDALHPQLGTLDDFRKLVAAARRNGLEIALDFAIQCSPDHPWLKQHHDWFKWRPDGSIKYAENPPKKYQDIVNVDFYADGPRRELWKALRDVVLFWAGEGVRVFRVDNPHTKPLPFWHWMIADVRARHPDVIFLSEAFTRPKMMYRLAKVGFSQSYTYFTWRNSKQEFIDYLTELTATQVREFFRPHFFVNTPDINPYFLQTSGRPGFLIRAALAATLSGLWGVYSGFELCEAAPLPGREEYLDSEKYEIRVRDQDAPGNIVAEITQLNRIRRQNPALQTHLGVTFYNAFNDQILLYGKLAPSRGEMILVAVSLDPHHVQEATFELPLWEWKLPDHGSARVEDLMREHATVWTGKLQQVRLDPAMPFAIWRVVPLGGTP